MNEKQEAVIQLNSDSRLELANKGKHRAIQISKALNAFHGILNQLYYEDSLPNGALSFIELIFEVFFNSEDYEIFFTRAENMKQSLGSESWKIVLYYLRENAFISESLHKEFLEFLKLDNA